MENKWSFKKAIIGQFKWDSSDWEYIKTHGVWFLVIIVLSLMYYHDVSITRSYMKSDCVKKCQLDSYINDLKEKNPTASINCDYKLMSCTVSGVDNKFNSDLRNRGFNISNE